MNEQTATTTIRQALSYPEGTPIGRIVGKVTHLFDRKTGEGDYGAYSSQSGVISDGEDKILFTLWNKPEIPHDYKGRVVIFRAGGGKKPTMTLKSDFKDNSKRTLNVTKSCIMLTEDEETDDIPFDHVETPKPQQNAPQVNVAPKKGNIDDALQDFMKSKPDPKEGIQSVKKRVMQYANLRSITDDAAAFLYQDQSTGMVERGIIEKIKDVSSCFFIQGVKDGLHFKLPDNKPIFGSKEDLESKKDEEF